MGQEIRYFSIHFLPHRKHNASSLKRATVTLFGSQQGQEILLFYKVSIPALGFTRSYSKGTCIPFPRFNQSGCDAYHSHPSSAEVMNACDCTSTPLPHVPPTALIHIYVNFTCLIHLKTVFRQLNNRLF
jgi:hypothetical protein